MIHLRSDECLHGRLIHSNPVYGGYFADPFVFAHGGMFYAVGTGGRAAPEGELEFPILRSSDMVRWERLGGALARTGERASYYWAPEVAEHDGVFYLYYSVGTS